MVEIEVGGVYTNSAAASAREVLELEGRDVVYREFVLFDGQPVSFRSRCAVRTFREWAARPCTPEESARLSRDVPAQAELLLRDATAGLIKLALAAASDDQLLAEVRRRGLSNRAGG